MTSWDRDQENGFLLRRSELYEQIFYSIRTAAADSRESIRRAEAAENPT